MIDTKKQIYILYVAGGILICVSWFFFRSIWTYLPMVITGSLFVYVGRKKSKEMNKK